MSISRAIRLLLLAATAVIVGWSFFDVARRVVAQRRAEHERPVTLTILHWGAKDEDVLVQQQVERYQQLNPRVRIVRINTGDSGAMRSKLKTMMAAGTPPDLFYLPPDILPDLATMKLIRPIDDYVKKEFDAGKAAWFEDFYPILIRSFRYDIQKQRSGDGPLYGLPKDFTTAVMYVNTDLFTKANVRVPYQGWTWDEFEQTTKKISDLNQLPEFSGRKIYGGFFTLWPDTIRNVVWTYGGDYFGKDFRDVLLDEPPAQEALRMILRARLTDKTVYNPSGIDKDGGQEFFTGNIGVIGPIGRWQTPRFKDISNFKWDVVPVPYKNKEFQASQIFMVAWTMCARTKHPDQAFEVMKFLSGGEGMIQMAHAGLAIPPLQSVANSANFL